jgi:diguanylate cyclase
MGDGGLQGSVIAGLIAICVACAAFNLSTRALLAESWKRIGWLAGGAFAAAFGMTSVHLTWVLARSGPLGMQHFALLASPLTIAVLTYLAALFFAGTSHARSVRLPAVALIIGVGIVATHGAVLRTLEEHVRVPLYSYSVIANLCVATVATLCAWWIASSSWVLGSARFASVTRLTAVAVGALGVLAPDLLTSVGFTNVSGQGLHWQGIALAALSLGILCITMVASSSGARLHARGRYHAREMAVAQIRLEYLATHDATTGLPNRALFTERVTHAMDEAIRKRGNWAVAVLDLDRFRFVNGSLGHRAGDSVLRSVAERLAEVLRPADVLARFGGDEFAVLLEDIGGRAELLPIIGRMHETLQTPLRVNGIDVHVSPSIGASLAPVTAQRADELFVQAEAALYRAKARGGNVFQLFEAGMACATPDRFALEHDLRLAIAARQLELVYQPQISASDSRIVGFEALLRWHHPVRGLITPSSFIPLAEETGLIVQIGEWVLREACRQGRRWRREHGIAVPVAVNLSAVQLIHDELVDVVRSALDAAGLEGECLELELTESSVMMNPEKSIRTLEQLRALGCRLCIDDFGTGYSSLGYLRRFSIDKLKIDRSFVRDLPVSRKDESIVRAIVALAHGLQLQVVAEGIESAEQLALVRALGCDQWQGYLCAPPLPAALTHAMLRKD